MWEVLVHTDDVTWISYIYIYIYHDVSPSDILVYLKIGDTVTAMSPFFL